MTMTTGKNRVDMFQKLFDSTVDTNNITDKHVLVECVEHGLYGRHSWLEESLHKHSQILDYSEKMKKCGQYLRRLR